MKQRAHVLWGVIAFAVGIPTCVPESATAQETQHQSLWLHVSGEHRNRYEYLWNQLRQAVPGNDAALSLRTTLLAELRYETVAAGVELADSRVYLTDDDTPLSTSHVNPVDVLQAYLSATVPDLLFDGSSLRLKVGRQTMDVGSRRFVARNRFRNTINSRTGLDLEWTGPGREIVRAFFTVPVERRVNSIRDNEPRLDIERTEAVFWGVFLRSRPWSGSVRGEFQLYGLHERDSEDFQTRNRSFVTPAFRFFRNPGAGSVDFEIESAIQAGTSRLTSLADDLADLQHLAFFLHASLGRTFAGKWQPRLILQYDYASGDEDPTDDSNGRFDTLFGARRFEYGPTGIYGAFARANVNSPGIRVALSPHSAVNGSLGYRTLWLAQARDAWTTKGVRDLEGSSDNFLGHQVEGRLRWWILPENMRFETGFAHLWLGQFPKSAPNGNPNQKNPVFLYAQLTVQF
jgi:hypothetical protein